MPKVTIPAKVATIVSNGTSADIVIGNNGSVPVALNTTSPETDGPAVTLGPYDSVAMAAGSAWAGATWYAYSQIGTAVTVTEV